MKFAWLERAPSLGLHIHHRGGLPRCIHLHRLLKAGRQRSAGVGQALHTIIQHFRQCKCLNWNVLETILWSSCHIASYVHSCQLSLFFVCLLLLCQHSARKTAKAPPQNIELTTKLFPGTSIEQGIHHNHCTSLQLGFKKILLVKGLSHSIILHLALILILYVCSYC